MKRGLRSWMAGLTVAGLLVLISVVATVRTIEARSQEAPAATATVRVPMLTPRGVETGARPGDPVRLEVKLGSDQMWRLRLSLPEELEVDESVATVVDAVGYQVADLSAVQLTEAGGVSFEPGAQRVVRVDLKVSEEAVADTRLVLMVELGEVRFEPAVRVVAAETDLEPRLYSDEHPPIDTQGLLSDPEAVPTAAAFNVRPESAHFGGGRLPDLRWMLWVRDTAARLWSRAGYIYPGDEIQLAVYAVNHAKGGGEGPPDSRFAHNVRLLVYVPFDVSGSFFPVSVRVTGDNIATYSSELMLRGPDDVPLRLREEWIGDPHEENNDWKSTFVGVAMKALTEPGQQVGSPASDWPEASGLDPEISYYRPGYYAAPTMTARVIVYQPRDRRDREPSQVQSGAPR